MNRVRSTVVYVVLVHKSPTQVARLVRRLATDRARFVVHVDRRAGRVRDEVEELLTDIPVEYVEDRRRCYWGGFGMVGATISALESLVRSGARFDHVLTLSGQDYPIRPPLSIEEFLGSNLGRTFMTYAPLPNEWPDGGLPRFERWHLVSPVVLHLHLPWRRRMPHGLVPYGGGAWICLSRAAVEEVVDRLRRQPEIVRFFEHTLHPDELLFQTLIMNSLLADTVVNDHLRYIDWSTDPGPATLRAVDLEKLLDSGAFLARKFDISVDSTILDLVDRRIEEETNVATG